VTEPAIELHGISKSFLIRHNAAHNLKVKFLGLFSPRNRESREVFWALRDVNLTVPKGEFLGLIGPNGSGKSTLLRVMSRIFRPTSGEIVMHGRVAPMIEIGVGFDFELTGQENIYLNTSLFRLSRKETEAIYDSIVAFSELEQFIDMPVKNYSTGMYVRLGFAAAVHLAPDILLIDEVLAVGDEAFQQKCLRKMEELRRAGTTIVLVSHSLETVELMCDRAALLVHGRLVAEGDPKMVIARYRSGEYGTAVSTPPPIPALTGP
jgi:ABC-type polysaccharide/polyol phosphate transport system ATPase subunit